MNLPSHHKYKSPKKFLLIVYLEISQLKDSKRTLLPLGATSSSHFSGQKVKWARQLSDQSKNCIKRQTGLIYLLIRLRTINNDFVKSVCQLLYDKNVSITIQR